MSYYQRLLSSQWKAYVRNASDTALWAFPALVGAGWFLWPAIDLEYKMSLGLAADPEAEITKVQEAKMKRMEIKLGPLKINAKKEAEPEEEEEPEEDDEDSSEDDAAVGGEDEAGDDDNGSEEEDEGGDEEETIVIKPLFVPLKGKKLSKEDIWDNFTIKALRMTEDDDDEDEDEDDE